MSLHTIRASTLHLVRRAAVALFVAGLVAGVSAHDIAVFPLTGPDGVRLRVRYGHPGDYQDTVAGKLVTLETWAPDGQRRSAAGRLRDDGLALITSPLGDLSPQGTWLVSAFYDNGFFLRTDDGRQVNTTRAEYPVAKTATHNIKFGKALFAVGAPGAGFDRVVGHRLEFVPRQNPLTLASGGTLDVELRFDGKPLAGATVFAYPEKESDPPAEVKTDASGVARVPVNRSGLFILGAEHGAPSRHPEMATRDAYAATLVFTVR